MKKLTLLAIIILLLGSCEITDYDFGPIHNHPPRLEITNLYTDGMLEVIAFDWYQENDTTPVEKVFNLWRYLPWYNSFGDYVMLPVEPDDFMIILTPENTYPPDTTIVKVTCRTKHVEVLIRHYVMFSENPNNQIK